MKEWRCITKHGSQIVAPKSAAYRPISHDRQSDDPFAAAYLPRGHSVHSVAPNNGEYRPSVQLLQLISFLFRDLPGGHCVHCH
jgi:hypothetical protein